MQHVYHMHERFRDLFHVFIYGFYAARQGEDQRVAWYACDASAQQCLILFRSVFDPDHLHDTGDLFVEKRFDNIRGEIPWADTGSAGGEDEIVTLTDRPGKKFQELFGIVGNESYVTGDGWLVVGERVFQKLFYPATGLVFVFAVEGTVGESDDVGCVGFGVIG